MYKKFIKTSFILLSTLFLSSPIISQTSFSDTISILTYNVNDYGTASSGSCPTLGSPMRHNYLRTIIQYLNAPDIIAFEKIYGTPKTFSTDSIRQKVLDSICMGCYAAAPYTNVSGYKKVNSLFYKTSKFGLSSTTGIYTADNNISDINLHKLYYKSLSLATTHDTIFINVIVVHDASGSSSQSIRGTEIGGAMNWLNTTVKTNGNYLFMGDFNTTSSNEACVQSMLNSTDTFVRFYDPINQLGDWSANPTTFAKYLTQSTRTSDPGDCAATGGINDRFDIIFINNAILKGNKNIQYVPNSYTIIGQDGLHNGLAINASPLNTSVPSNVLNALYLMSEHLPVCMKMIVSKNYQPVPLNFEYFKYNNSSTQVNLFWKVVNEDKLKDYLVEVSDDNFHFYSISTIQKNNSNNGIYQYTDNNVYSSLNRYYRIRQQFNDGNSIYSDIIELNNKLSTREASIAPNPVKGLLNLKLINNNSEKAKISVMNTFGQILLQYNTLLQKGENNISISIPENIEPGLYIANVITENNNYSSKFIKE